MPSVDPLQTAALYSRCDPGQFSFRTTDELEELENSLGQDRAIEALRFGIAIGCRGYNMFALGPPGGHGPVAALGAGIGGKRAGARRLGVRQQLR